jgi:hypothetical protein
MTVALYQKYRDAFDAIPPTGRPMPYDWSNLPSPLGIQWMAYGLILPEFSRELANIINRLTADVPRLEAWSKVVAPLSEEDKMRANLEFIDPLATVAVCRPSVIRSRFAFAAAHLCHQANRAKQGKAWRDDLPLDQKIYMDTAEKVGAGWRKFGRLKLRLEKINGAKFKTATHDFRNAYNHRFSPHFAVGMSQIATRKVDRAKVTYGYGLFKPLDLGELAELLTVERDRCYAAFEAFQALVAEHEAVIAKTP